VNSKGTSTPVLPSGLEDDEVQLWRAFRQDRLPDAREALFSLHVPFARQIARRHYVERTSADIEFPDLCQLAYAGLLEALDRFDEDRGVPFRRYAAKRITGSIRDGVAKMSEVREQISFRSRNRSERAQSLAAADADSLPLPDALQALIDIAVGLALGFMLEGTGLFLESDAPDAHGGGYESLAWKEAVQQVMVELAKLPKREQVVIRRHYLDGLTFDQIGTVLNITKSRVSQLHKAAIILLRKRLPGSAGFRLER